MSANTSREFENYLSSKFRFTSGATSKFDTLTTQDTERTLRKLWESTDLSANDFANEVAEYYGLPRLSLPQLIGASSLVGQFSQRFLRETAVFPYQTAEGQSKLVVVDPTDLAAIRAAEIVLGGPVEIEIASFEDIATALTKRLGEDDAASADVKEAALAHADDDIESLRDLASGAPVVRAVNDLLEKAVETRASDIHIEPHRTGLAVRMRIDGMLRPVPAPTGVLPQALISRVKILSGLNIAERRLPQDGAARLRVARSEIDIRVATMPTQHGESAVIRLLPRDRGLLEIGRLGPSRAHEAQLPRLPPPPHRMILVTRPPRSGKTTTPATMPTQHGESAVIRLLPRDRGLLEIGRLGLSRADEAKLLRLLALPHGMIVITGPTGSGKTTTLATMLSILNETTRKILTIEDPVEYEIQGINQTQVKPAIGLNFATALRAFVRQDPDVIMVGEIRDAETANIAIHAALTGHLVLTTLHTETAAAAVPRLLDLKVEGFLLRSTLRAVIAQRLVRILCDRCKKPKRLTDDDHAADPRYAAIGLKKGEM